jgi:hypothetical protein
MPTLLSAMTRLFWISRDANGYRWQPLTTGCAMQQHVRELNFSDERRLIRGCTVVAQLWPNQSYETRTRVFSSEDKLCLPKIPCSPWRKSFLQTNGQPCFNLVKRIRRCAPVREHCRTRNFKISNGKNEQHAALEEVRQAAVRDVTLPVGRLVLIFRPAKPRGCTYSCHSPKLLQRHKW